MELDLKSLLGLHAHSCTHWLRPHKPQPPPPLHLGSYLRALLVSQDRRHFFVTPAWSEENQPKILVSITWLVYGTNLCPISPNPEGIQPLKSHFHPRWKEWRKLPRVRDLYFPSGYFGENLDRKVRQFLFFLHFLLGILRLTNPESNNFVSNILWKIEVLV